MTRKTVKSPTSNLLTGEIGPPLAIISRSEIRAAEKLDHEESFETLDGFVDGRPGDVVMTTASKERYPILQEIFYGTYEVLGAIGNRMVARRLIHERRAWPVLSEHASYNYGDDRGVVLVERGGWLYQSDERDFGVINAEVNHRGHVVLGPLEQFEGADWRRRYFCASTVLAWLPATMSLLALLALVDDARHAGWLLAESGLLLAGSVLAWRMRAGRWSARAAVTAAVALSREFQVAAELLGWRGSIQYPGMALWRAAQLGRKAPEPGAPTQLAVTKERLLRLKEVVGSTLAAIREEATSHAEAHHHARLGTILAALLVLTLNAVLLAMHETGFQRLLEVVAIWVPALVGGFHAIHAQRQVVERGSLLRELHAQLKFVSDQVFALMPRDAQAAAGADVKFEESLRILCRTIGRHSQRQFEWALAEDPLPPV